MGIDASEKEITFLNLNKSSQGKDINQNIFELIHELHGLSRIIICLTLELFFEIRVNLCNQWTNSFRRRDISMVGDFFTGLPDEQIWSL